MKIIRLVLITLTVLIQNRQVVAALKKVKIATKPVVVNYNDLVREFYTSVNVINGKPAGVINAQGTLGKFITANNRKANAAKAFIMANKLNIPVNKLNLANVIARYKAVAQLPKVDKAKLKTAFCNFDSKFILTLNQPKIQNFYVNVISKDKPTANFYKTFCPANYNKIAKRLAVKTVQPVKPVTPQTKPISPTTTKPIVVPAKPAVVPTKPTDKTAAEPVTPPVTPKDTQSLSKTYQPTEVEQQLVIPNKTIADWLKFNTDFTAVILGALSYGLASKDLNSYKAWAKAWLNDNQFVDDTQNLQAQNASNEKQIKFYADNIQNTPEFKNLKNISSSQTLSDIIYHGFAPSAGASIADIYTGIAQNPAGLDAFKFIESKIKAADPSFNLRNFVQQEFQKDAQAELQSAALSSEEKESQAQENATENFIEFNRYLIINTPEFDSFQSSQTVDQITTSIKTIAQKVNSSVEDVFNEFLYTNASGQLTDDQMAQLQTNLNIQ